MQFTANPSDEHLNSLNRITNYLNAMSEVKLTIKPAGCRELKVYSNADWVSAKTDRKSISGYAIYLGGTLIAWNSK